MLEAWIIEELKRQERERQQQEEENVLRLPLDEMEYKKEEDKKDDNGNTIIEIEFMSLKKTKTRDWLAVDAHFRNSAGSFNLKQKKEEKYSCRSFKKNWRSVVEEEMSEDVSFAEEIEELDIN